MLRSRGVGQKEILMGHGEVAWVSKDFGVEGIDRYTEARGDLEGEELNGKGRKLVLVEYEDVDIVRLCLFLSFKILKLSWIQF